MRSVAENIIESKQKSGILEIAKFAGAVFFVFLLIYQPPLTVNLIYALTIFSWLVIIVERRFSYNLLAIIGVFALAIIWLSIPVIIFQTSFSNISHLFWLTFCIIPSAYVFHLYTKRYSFDRIINVIVIASFLQAIIGLISFLSSDFNLFLRDLMIKNNLYSLEHIESFGYRIYGYGTSLMYAIPVVQGMISAWTLLYGMLKKKWIYYPIAFVIFITSVINARITLFTFIAVLVVLLFTKNALPKKNLLKLIAILGISIFAITQLLGFLSTYNTDLFVWLNNLTDRDIMKTWYFDYYTDSDKLSLPDGIGIFIGTGGDTKYWSRNFDVGFINDIWLGGLPYLFFTIAAIIFLTYRIKKASKIESPWNHILSYSFIITFIVANIKGISFTYSAFMALLFLIALI